jgi:hypothetical protein
MLMLAAPLLLSAQVSAEAIEKEQLAKESFGIMLRGGEASYEFGLKGEFGYGYGYNNNGDEYSDELQQGRRLWGISWSNLFCRYSTVERCTHIVSHYVLYDAFYACMLIPSFLHSFLHSFLYLQSTLECAIHRQQVTIINARLLPLPAAVPIVTDTPIRTLCLDATAPTVTLPVRITLTFVPAALRTAAPAPAIRMAAPAPPPHQRAIMEATGAGPLATTTTAMHMQMEVRITKMVLHRRIDPSRVLPVCFSTQWLTL